MNQQLLDYVKQQLGTGISSDNLHKILAPQGWTTEDINQAITTVVAVAPVVTAPPVMTASVAQATPAVQQAQTMPARPAAAMPVTATPVTPAVGVRIASIAPVTSQMSAQKGLSGTTIAGFLIAFLLIGGTAAVFLVPELKSNVFGFVSRVTGLSLEGEQIVDPAPRQNEVVPASDTLLLATPLQSDWIIATTSVATGLLIEYPRHLKVTSNESEPVVHITLEENSGNAERVFISAANINTTNQSLASWLKTNDYFRHKYRSQIYTSYKRADGVEVLASFGNAKSYDDAFIQVGTAVVYIENGVNENTKIKEGEFREIIERIKLPSALTIGVTGSSFKCLIEGDELMTLYFGAKYIKTNPAVPFVYAPGSYCESADKSKILTLAYIETTEAPNRAMQAITLLDKDEKIIGLHKEYFCHTVGDLGAPRITSVEQGTINLFCFSGDAGVLLFDVYQAPITTLVPVKMITGSPVFEKTKKIVEKLYGMNLSSASH